MTKLSNSIPTANGKFPLLGHVVPLLRDPTAFLMTLPPQGDLLRIDLGPISAVIVTDPELTFTVIRTHKTFDRGGVVMNRVREAVGDGLSSCPYSAHHRQRRLLQPTFDRRMLPTYASIMSERIAALAESWRDGTVIDVPTEFQKLTSTILIATLYPDATFDPAAQQTLNDIRTVFDGVLRRSFMPPPFDRLPTPRNRAFEGAISRLRATLASLIADRRADEVNPGDMLSALLGAGDVDYPSFTDDEVTDQILTFFLGGTESTATTLTWALYLLDHHPQIASQLHAEVDEILAGRPAQLQDIPQLEFTGRIINETLRHRTPFWLLTRIVTEDTELGGYHLPVGTTVFYSPHMLHHRPDVFVDPERFDPDRWESTAPTVSPRQGFTPFGTGARKCIGDEFAVTQATLALATITARWRFRTLPDADTRLAPSVVQRPRRLYMRFTSRSTAHHVQALETA